MTIKDSSTASGALVQQWDYTANTNTNDEWYLERAYNYGYKGFAIYCNLPTNTNLDWHAGLMDEPYATSSLPVIHVNSMLSPVVNWSSFDDFLSNNTFQGVYRPKKAMTDYDRGLVIALARQLKDEDIGYILTAQMQATALPTESKITPDKIQNLRCDGLVEYCYEYYGYRIFGNDQYWDISKSDGNNIMHHAGNPLLESNISPKKQAQNYMIKVQSSIPSQIS